MKYRLLCYGVFFPHFAKGENLLFLFSLTILNSYNYLPAPIPCWTIVGGGTTAPRAGVTIPTGGTWVGDPSALLKPRPDGSAIPGGAWNIENLWYNEFCYSTEI